ncbi:MAG: M28 family peptidase [candidate division Zixibacteria bacterium]
MKNTLLLVLIVLILRSLSISADLYRIKLSSHADAEYLNSTGVEPVAMLFRGYLVMADKSQAYEMESRGIELRLIEAGVDKSFLGIDMRRDRKNVDRFDLIYEEGAFRLFRLEPMEKSRILTGTEIMPVADRNIIFTYVESVEYDESSYVLPGGLEELIGQISIDSLVAFSEHLESYMGRVTGTIVNFQVQEWLSNKFIEMGYTDVYYDRFTFNFDGSTKNCRNVIAVKEGTKYPDHQIIIGAHYDTYSGWVFDTGVSPGADDNGSGMAAVLEIARVLKDIETDVTILFILFDGEEFLCKGSGHYANEAYARGDDIIFMLNLDMIGARRNGSSVYINHGNDMKYAYLCELLGDTLLNINGHFITEYASDQRKFWEVGYNALMIHEYEFSEVWHTVDDLVQFLTYDYMTSMTKLALATVYSIDNIASPNPSLLISYPLGLPSSLPAGETSFLEVQLEGLYGGEVMPGTINWHYSISGENYVTVPMTEKSSGIYEVEIPGMLSGTQISYYADAEEINTGVVSGGNIASADNAYYLYPEQSLFEDGFAQDFGWQVEGNASEGIWERGIPEGDGLNGDPLEDFDGDGWCYLTGNNIGNSERVNGVTSLISPMFDLSDKYGEVRYAIWFENGPYREDIMSVYLSGNGGIDWIKVDSIGPVSGCGGSWQTRSFLMNFHIGNSSQVRVKFVVSDYNQSGIEAGLDAFRVLLHSSDPLEIPDQAFSEWTKGEPYTAQVYAIGGLGDIAFNDIDDSFSLAGLVLHSDGLIEGQLTKSGQLNLLVEALNEVGNSAMGMISFLVNEPVALHTFSLPGGMIRESYSQQLNADGGTGELIWIDKYGDLEGTGLSLSSTGLVSGVVEDPRLIGFTVYISDITGSDQEWTYEMNFEYIDGDANGDNVVNVGDAVFIINHVFKHGPSPYPYLAADTNCDGDVNIGDAVYLVNHIFKDWPAPGC